MCFRGWISSCFTSELCSCPLVQGEVFRLISEGLSNWSIWRHKICNQHFQLIAVAWSRKENAKFWGTGTTQHPNKLWLFFPTTCSIHVTLILQLSQNLIQVPPWLLSAIQPCTCKFSNFWNSLQKVIWQFWKQWNYSKRLTWNTDYSLEGLENNWIQKFLLGAKLEFVLACGLALPVFRLIYIQSFLTCAVPENIHGCSLTENAISWGWERCLWDQKL